MLRAPAGAHTVIRSWRARGVVRPGARVGLCAALVIAYGALASTASAKHPTHNQLASVGDMIFLHNQEVNTAGGGPGIGVAGFVGNAVGNYSSCSLNQMASGDPQQTGWVAIQQDGQQETSDLNDGLVAFNSSLGGWIETIHSLERVVGRSGKADLQKAALDIADAEDQHGLEIAALQMSAGDLSAATPDCEGSFNELAAAAIPGTKAWHDEYNALDTVRGEVLAAAGKGSRTKTLSSQVPSKVNPYACLGAPPNEGQAVLVCPIS